MIETDKQQISPLLMAGLFAVLLIFLINFRHLLGLKLHVIKIISLRWKMMHPACYQGISLKWESRITNLFSSEWIYGSLAS